MDDKRYETCEEIFWRLSTWNNLKHHIIKNPKEYLRTILSTDRCDHINDLSKTRNRYYEYFCENEIPLIINKIRDNNKELSKKERRIIDEAVMIYNYEDHREFMKGLGIKEKIKIYRNIKY